MFEIKKGDGAGRPLRLTSDCAPIARQRWLGPGLDLDVRSFAAGSSSFSDMLRAVDSRERVSAPYEEVPTLRACLKVKYQAVASVPLLFYRGDPTEDRKAKQIKPDDRELGGIVRLFRAPNALQTASMFFGAGSLHRSIDGEDFWFLLDINRNPVNASIDGTFELPFSILPVRGRVVTHSLDDFGFPTKWSFPTGGGKTFEAPRQTVIQFSDYNPDDPLRGLGDVETLYADIDDWWQAVRYNRALVKRGGDPGGFITVEGAASLAPAEAAAAQRDVEQKFSVANAGDWRVLPKGLKYTPNNISPKDMNFIDLMKFTRATIAMVTGVPLPILGDLEHATLNNFAEAVRMFWEGGNGVVPYLQTIEDVLINRFVRKVRLPGVEDVYARFDLRKVKALREDTTKQWEIVAKLTAIGCSLEEATTLIGIEADTSTMKSAKAHFVPSTVVPLDSLVDANGNAHADDGTDDADAAESAALPGGQPVQDTALNGAQVSAILDITAQVSAETLSVDGAIAIMLVAFPTIDEAEARRIAEGAIKKPPEPNPAAAPGETPAPVEQPADDGEKAAPITRDAEAAPLADAQAKAAAERRAYWESRSARVLEKGEVSLRRIYKAWRRKFERAQLARLRAAADGKSFRKDADDGPLDDQPSFTAADVVDLLLNDAEWIAKLRAAVDNPIARIFADALDDLSTDLGTEPAISGTESIIAQIEQQLITLAQEHTDSLANQVREVLVEELSKANSTGSVSAALTERLTEVEDALSETWSDRVTRGARIARTETGTAVNAARKLQMRTDGVTKHEWVSSKDSIVRGTPGGPYENAEYSHYDLDGKVVHIDEEFAPGLSVPGDVRAPAGQRINCRCLSRPVFEQEEGGTPAEE